MRELQQKIEKIKEYLAKLPNRCDLLEDYFDGMVNEQERLEAEKYLVEVYEGNVTSIYLILSSGCALFISFHEDQLTEIEDSEVLFFEVMYDLFSKDFEEDLTDEERKEVYEEVKQILDKALEILNKNKI